MRSLKMVCIICVPLQGTVYDERLSVEREERGGRLHVVVHLLHILGVPEENATGY